jgi:hypothetical protein
MKLEPSLLEASEDAVLSVSRKQIHLALYFLVSTLGRVSDLQQERVKRPTMFPECSANAAVDLVLQDIKVKVDKRRVLMRSLQTHGVIGNWESGQGITEQRPQNLWRLVDLGLKQVNGPYRVRLVRPELDQKHFARHKLVRFATARSFPLTASVLGPNVGLGYASGEPILSSIACPASTILAARRQLSWPVKRGLISSVQSFFFRAVGACPDCAERLR